MPRAWEKFIVAEGGISSEYDPAVCGVTELINKIVRFEALSQVSFNNSPGAFSIVWNMKCYRHRIGRLALSVQSPKLSTMKFKPGTRTSR